MRRRADAPLPRPYRLVLALTLRPWLGRRERDEIARDLVELRGAYRDRRGVRGLAAYTWRQSLQYPLSLLASPRRAPIRSPESHHAMEALMTDLRTGLRGLRRAPVQSLTIVAILALAIGANSAIYSVVRSVLVAPLPYPEPDRVVAVWMTGRDGSLERVTPGNFTDVRETGLFEAIGAFSGGSSTTLTPEDGEPEILRGGAVTAGYFETLGRAPLLGRTFSAAETAVGGPSVTVLGHGLWTRRFGSDPDIVGKTASFQGAPFEIVGVMPSGVYPTSAALAGTMPLLPGGPDYWVPLRYSDALYGNRRPHILGVIGRLRPDITFQAAAAALDTLGTGLAEQDPINENEGLALTPFRSEVVGAVERALLLLLLTVGAVLLIASSNVAALLLVRAEARHGELAVRAALGARRGRLVRLQLAETLMLAAAGGAIGLAATPRALDLLRTAIPTEIPRIQDASVDLGIAGVTTLLVLGVAFASGLAPALIATRRGLLASVRQATPSSGVSATRRRLQSSLVVGQSAMAVVLLVVSALLVRSFVQLTAVDLGYQERGVLAIPMNAPGEVGGDWPTLLAFWSSVRDRLAEVPGVEAVGMGVDGPLERSWLDGFGIEGRGDDPIGSASLRRVSPGYFATLRVPVVAGRDVSSTDRADAAPVVLVNEALARAHFDGIDPIGTRIAIPSMQRMYGDAVPATREIVGVVGNVRYLGPDAQAEPAIYFPLDQFPSGGLVALVREDGSRPDAAAGLRDALRSIDRTLAVRGVQRLTVLVQRFTASARFSTVLVGVFGSIGLILSAMGIYALVSRVVMQRRREFGIRLAVGAPSWSLAGNVTRSALRPAAVGVVLGLAIATPIARALRSQLFEITPLDPVSYTVAPALLLATAGLAAALCLRRALSTDPVEALRAE